jgi:cation transport regulator
VKYPFTPVAGGLRQGIDSISHAIEQRALGVVVMPYESKSDLPDSVKDNLPSHAQDIYKEAFNSAWEQYEDPSERRGGQDREETAHRVAWAAVKQSYAKGEDGRWSKKD